jgi:hypothetical protein
MMGDYPMKAVTCLLALAPVLAACQSTKPAEVAPVAPAASSVQPTPPPSAGMAVSRGNMPAYCRGAAASDFATKPVYIKTGPVTQTPEGFSIKGTADLGDQGKKPFQCKYDAKGNFIGVASMVDEGYL